jgi:hypothetical protein
MKYIINESRFNNIINEYINSIVGLPIKKHNHPSSFVNYVWFTNNKGESVFESDDNGSGLELGVRDDIWVSVQGMFSLSVNETDNRFSEWMGELYGVEFPGGVYTFERTND